MRSRLLRWKESGRRFSLFLLACSFLPSRFLESLQNKETGAVCQDSSRGIAKAAFEIYFFVVHYLIHSGLNDVIGLFAKEETRSDGKSAYRHDKQTEIMEGKRIWW